MQYSSSLLEKSLHPSLFGVPVPVSSVSGRSHVNLLFIHCGPPKLGRSDPCWSSPDHHKLHPGINGPFPSSDSSVPSVYIRDAGPGVRRLACSDCDAMFHVDRLNLSLQRQQ